jgi:hypothetical protein
MDIYNFLPKYPNVWEFTEDFLNLYPDNFEETIYKKKEFYDEKLESSEPFPDSKGTLMKHQKIISHFLSSHTMYDQLLLLHEMGTGKSCSSIGAIEKIKNENNSFTGAMIFARGSGLLNNFINELVFKCTDGRYIPEDYDDLSELEKTHRVKKQINSFYRLYTFETFAKDLSKIGDSEIARRYSNKIIVIDEVHNIRIQSVQIEISIYEQFHRFLHIVENCKIILMSGTPMKSYL